MDSDPAESSKAQERCGDGNIQRSEALEESGQAASRKESISTSKSGPLETYPNCTATDVQTMKGPCEVEHSDSAREVKKRRVEQGPGELCNGSLRIVPMERPHAGDISTLDMLAGMQRMLGDLMEMRPLYEDWRQAQELSTLGVSAYKQFELTGNAEELDRAIEYWGVAVALSQSFQTERWGLLSNLGAAYLSRFGRLGEAADLGSAIDFGEEAVSLTPDDHPGKPSYLNNLGGSYWTRFERLGELSDLNKAIEFKAQAVLLTPDGDPKRPGRLSNLGVSYETRFKRLGELSDLEKAIESQAQAVLLAPDGHPNKPECLNNLGVSYQTRFQRLGEASDLNKAIEFQAQAVSLTPGGHPSKPGSLNSLGNSYMIQFERLGELSDLNKAVEYHVHAVSLVPDDYPDRPGYFANLGVSYKTRFERLGELSDLNKAIESNAQAVSLTPGDHPDRPARLNNLGSSYVIRFGRLGDLSDVNKAIESQAQAVLLTPDGHPDKPKHLNNLGISYETRFARRGELSDLNKAIESQALAISLIPEDHPDKPACLSNLGNSYVTRFERSSELSDVNNAIESLAQAISLIPEGHPDKPGFLSNLGKAYRARCIQINEPSDLRLVESSFRRASQSSTGPPSVRFAACKMWAIFSSYGTTSSPLLAYQQGMSLIPQLVWIGTTISRRYELVAEASNFATEAVSQAISIGSYDLALEWLEAGRSIVWGQIAQLRTPFEHLSAHHSQLAEALASIGRQLECAGSRPSSFASPVNSEPDLGQEARTHIHLALEWDRLLKEIREIPGFEDFLCPPSAGRLLGAAKAHPIAVINIDGSRCDALILQPDCVPISHVALTNFSSKDALLARDHVFSQVRSRRPGQLNPSGPLHSSLERVWSGVIKPILDFLGYTREMPVDQLPQITWCTSGLLSFIPLHAARSYDEPQLSTFDLVISSYTPTLSALLSSQSTDPSSSCGIVAVGQESTPGLNPLPCTTTELAVIHKHTASEYFLQLEDDEATVEQVLDAMDQFSWVHMACHGSQDPHDPTNSAFHLHGDNLTLATITKRAFTNKGLAFLSACQTATGDENMPDEAVHLAAGMLMAGYPSVIGTMWSIADEDGPEVADLVYAELLKDGKMDHTKSARALHRAVAQLRAKVGGENISRWAPFIHIGS